MDRTLCCGEPEIRPWTHMMEVPQLHGFRSAANRLLEAYNMLLKLHTETAAAIDFPLSSSVLSSQLPQSEEKNRRFAAATTDKSTRIQWIRSLATRDTIVIPVLMIGFTWTLRTLMPPQSFRNLLAKKVSKEAEKLKSWLEKNEAKSAMWSKQVFTSDEVYAKVFTLQDKVHKD
ncbi:hypothetical protein HID58_045679 [Brassica napus]|uniref:Uncharacterized protein n=1 Tax=Brassica napus TaxID=3708 RepID=A0ABQ8AU86_BRANA|nr:hypothetical protein HID58_045679 [Brassica napus]